MKEEHPLNIDECKEHGKLEMTKEVVITLCGMGLLMTMLPILLNILGVESFTIGSTNSIFTIFEYYSIGEGFGFDFFPLTLVAISVIVGLVYAIINAGKPKNDAMKG